MSRGKPTTKTKRIARASPAMHPPYRRWKIDMDYLDKLNPEEQAFMAQFIDEEYAADFRWEEPFNTTDTEKRALYVDQNRTRRDITGRANAGGVMYSLDLLTDVSSYHPLSPNAPDITPVPQYQGTGEYREALVTYRTLVDTAHRTTRQQEQLEILGTYLISISASDPTLQPEDEDEDIV